MLRGAASGTEVPEKTLALSKANSEVDGCGGTASRVCIVFSVLRDIETGWYPIRWTPLVIPCFAGVILLLGGLAQLGERLLCKQEVSGSSPLISTITGR